ncbi:MAG TPA: hypothetical protein VFV99_02740 [Kofleriaceae bacterium]|nr:hypothetical protein [Kofleriaceae bacterium]
MRGMIVVLGLALAACTVDIARDVDLKYANARVPYQTDPAAVQVYETDVAVPYDVLGDLEVVVRQKNAFSEAPTKEHAIAALRAQAGRIGAHAIVLVDFGKQGMSWWSYNELRGHGRAIRFR